MFTVSFFFFFRSLFVLTSDQKFVINKQITVSFVWSKGSDMSGNKTWSKESTLPTYSRSFWNLFVRKMFLYTGEGVISYISDFKKGKRYK